MVAAYENSRSRALLSLDPSQTPNHRHKVVSNQPADLKPQLPQSVAHIWRASQPGPVCVCVSLTCGGPLSKSLRGWKLSERPSARLLLSMWLGLGTVHWR